MLLSILLIQSLLEISILISMGKNGKDITPIK